MYELGLKPREIAEREGVPADSIRGIVARYATQASAQSQPRSGRPPIISEREKSVILRIMAENPSITHANLLREAGLTCSVRTLTRYLKSKPKPSLEHMTATATATQQPEINEEAASK